ncbi:MAG: WG repeat-containing protein [Saprospiraceae bacterium]|nr:WG repeat-containing protein [Saprospiraceae bacterium]
MQPLHPIPDFIKALADKGFDTSKVTPFQVWEALRGVKKNSDANQLKAGLEPLFCTSPEEIAIFSGVFEAWLPALSKVAGQDIPRFGGILLILLVFATLLSGVVYQWVLPSATGCTNPGSSNYDPFARRACEDCCRENPYKGLVACMDTSAINFNPNARVPCEDCCSYRGCMDQKALNYNVKARISCTSCCEYPGFAALADQSDRSFAAFKTKLEPTVIDLPPGLEVIPTNGWFFWYKWKILLATLGLSWSLAFVTARVVFLRRKQNLIPLVSPTTAVPGLRIPAKTRLHFEKHPGFADVKGLFLKEKSRSKGAKTNKYLFFLEKEHTQAHFSVWLDQLFLELKTAKVAIERFLVDTSTGKVYNEQHQEGTTMDALFRDHGGAIALLFTSEETRILPRLPWKDQAVLTCLSPRDWDDSVLQLGSATVLAPASLEGLQAVLEGFRGKFTVRPEEWMAEAEKFPATFAPKPGLILEELDRCFSEDIRRWIAACALAPELSWEFTLAIGKALFQNRWETLSHESLLRVFQLPWFAEGRIPEEARLLLAKHPLLTEDVRKKTHAAIAGVLRDYPTSGSQTARAKDLAKIHESWSRNGAIAADKEAARLQKKEMVAPKKLPLDASVVTGSVLAILFLLLTQVKIAIFDTAFLLPGSPVLYSWSDDNAQRTLNESEDLYRFLRYLELYALDEAALTLETLFLNDPSDSVSLQQLEKGLELAYAGIYNQALELHRNEYYNLSVSLVNRMHQSIQKSLAGHGIALSSLYDGFEPLSLQPIRLWYLMGLNFFQLGDPITAGMYQEAIERNSLPAGAEEVRIPNLSHLLTYDAVDTFSQGRLRVKSNGKYGFLDEQGLPVPDSLGEAFVFDFAYNFFNGKALVKQDNRFSFVDKDLRVLQSNNFVTWNPAMDSLSGQFGFKDENDNWVIAPQYLEVFPFSGDLARVRRPDGRMSWIQRNGRWFTPYSFDEVRDFSFGYAAARMGNQWGYVDLSGDLRIACRFDAAGDFERNYRASVNWKDRTFEVNVNGLCTSRECPEKVFSVLVLDAERLTPVPRARFYNATWGTYYTDKEGDFTLNMPELNLPLSVRFFVVADGYTGGTYLIHFSEAENALRILLE